MHVESLHELLICVMHAQFACEFSPCMCQCNESITCAWVLGLDALGHPTCIKCMHAQGCAKAYMNMYDFTSHTGKMKCFFVEF